MARVKHTLQNGVVHLRQQNSGKLAAIDVSLYEYINEEDKPADEYEFRNGGQSSFSFTAKGGTETSSIISRYGHDGSWEDVGFSCTNHPDWATVTTTANSVSIKASANEETSLKSGSVELTQDTSNKKITIAVTLAGVESGGGDPHPEPEDPYVFTIDQSSFTIEAEGNGEDISSGVGLTGQTATVTSTKDGEWVDFYADGLNLGVGHLINEWLLIVKNHTSGGTATLMIAATKNTTDSSRSATITLKQSEGSTKTLTLTVTQNAASIESEVTYEFTATPQAIRPEAAGGTSEVDVVSTKDGKPQGWDISVQPTGNYAHATKGENKVTIVVDANSDESEREDSVTIKQEESDETRRIDIYQKGNKTTDLNYYLKSTPSALKFEYSGGDKNVAIDSYCDADGEESGVAWKYKSGGQSWLSGYDTSGPGRYGTVNITCEENKTTVGRNTTLVYEQEFPGSAECNVVVQQAAKPEETTYSLTISPDSLELSPAQQTSSQSITITSKSHTGEAEADIPWKYVTGAGTWVTGYPESGTTPNTFNVTVEANTTPNERECTLQYKQDDPGTGTATLRVRQGGTSASLEHVYLFNATPDSVNFDYSASDKSVVIRSLEDGQPIGWEITAGGDSEWCHVSKSDHNTLEVRADENKKSEEKTNERSLQVTLTQDTSGQKANISITQGGYTPPLDEEYTYYFDVSPNSNIEFQVDNAPSAKVTVNSYKKSASSENVDVDFDYTVDDSYNGFITVEQDPEFQSDKHHLLVKPKENNTTGEDRTGTITFKQKEPSESGQQKSVTINVTQKAPKGGV